MQIEKKVTEFVLKVNSDYKDIVDYTVHSCAGHKNTSSKYPFISIRFNSRKFMEKFVTLITTKVPFEIFSWSEVVMVFSKYTDDISTNRKNLVCSVLLTLDFMSQKITEEEFRSVKVEYCLEDEASKRYKDFIQIDQD